MRWIICLLFFLLTAGGLLWPQDYSIQVDPNPVVRGNRFDIDIIIDHEDPLDIAVEEFSLPSGIYLYWGPSIRPIIITEMGTQKTVIRITYRLTAAESGHHVISGSEISLKDERITLDSILISVGTVKDSQIVTPLQPEWRTSRESVYVGESLLLELFLSRINRLVLPDRIDFSPPSGGLFEEVPLVSTVQVEEFERFELYDLPVSAYLFTPTITRDINIPSAAVTSGAAAGSSPSLNIQVQSLPEAVSTTGAVGDFSAEAAILQETLKVDEPFTVEIKVSGCGNFPVMNFPKIKTEGLQEIERREIESYIPDSEGYRGSRTLEVDFVPTSEGIYNLFIDDFVWIDRDTRDIKSTSLEVKLPEVTASGESMDASAEDPAVFSLVKEKRISHSGYTPAYRNLFWYLTLLPGAVAVLLFLFVRRPLVLVVFILLGGVFWILLMPPEFVPQEDLITEGYRLFEEEEYTAAAGVFNEAGGEGEVFTGLDYNIGICLYLADLPGPALWSIRRSIYYEPGNSLYRKTLRRMEDQLGLEYQIRPVSTLSPNLPFFLLLAGWNLMALFYFLYQWKGGGVYLLGQYMLMVVMVISAAVLAGVLIDRSNPEGIVLSDAQFTRIPSRSASPYLEIPAGTAVSIKAERGGFILTETGYALEGWLPEEQIISAASKDYMPVIPEDSDE